MYSSEWNHLALWIVLRYSVLSEGLNQFGRIEESDIHISSDSTIPSENLPSIEGTAWSYQSLAKRIRIIGWTVLLDSGIVMAIWRKSSFKKKENWLSDNPTNQMINLNVERRSNSPPPKVELWVKRGTRHICGIFPIKTLRRDSL